MATMKNPNDTSTYTKDRQGLLSYISDLMRDSAEQPLLSDKSEKGCASRTATYINRAVRTGGVKVWAAPTVTDKKGKVVRDYYTGADILSMLTSTHAASKKPAK